MQFLILVLLVCFFIYLFSLYRLSHDDFVFIRKTISMEMISNITLWTAFISLVVARIIYIFSFPKPVFFTFLGSVLFPYFPGLSLVGAVLGGSIFLSLYCFYKKIPLGRMLDFSAVSLLFSLPLGFLYIYFVSGRHTYILASLIFYIIFLLFTIFVSLPLLTMGKIKDGVLGLLFLVIFSLFTIIINIFVENFKFAYSIENIILFSGLIFSLSLLIYKQFIGKKSY
jgi:hypothetical protein